jgi:truncated hemoglobin YjbI
MEHRRFLPHREAHRPFVGGDLFRRVGGPAAIDALIDGLYQGIETDAALRPLFGRDLANEREAQKRFFTEWLGGEGMYSDRTHYPLKHRHDLLPITRALAAKWLGHFQAALDVAVSDVEAREAIARQVRTLALALVNETEPPSALRAHPHGTCLRYKPAVESLGLARRGDVSGLRKLLERAPDVLASTPHAASLLQLAALGGRTPVVKLLLDRGVDANKPSPVEPLIFLTPLCAARAKRREEVEALLIDHGAREDLFTHAFLGDLERLEADLVREPLSAQAIDPAVDALEITPVHHAVAGERADALRALLTCAKDQPLLTSRRAIRDAATRENVRL